jgi:protein-arginine kinase activator protein McsA
MTEKRKPGTHWRCKKCDDTYTTPLPVKQVLCATCNKRLGVNRVWMHNDD